MSNEAFVVIAGMAVDNGMFSRYRRILKNDCVLSAATDAADSAEFDGNRSCAVRILNLYVRDNVRHDPILQFAQCESITAFR